MKKLVSLFLACLMVLSIGMIPAFATTETLTVCATEESLTADTALAKTPAAQPGYAGTVETATAYKVGNGVMVRKDASDNVYFEIAADTTSQAKYYEHKLAIMSNTNNTANKTLKRFTAKVKLPSVTEGSTYVFGQEDVTSLSGTSRIKSGFGVQLVSGQAQYYDAETTSFVNFLNDGVTLSADAWYTIEAVMDARGVDDTDKKVYMNAFVYDASGTLIGNSGWQLVATSGGKWGKVWYTTNITAGGYAEGTKVLVDEFKEYVLSEAPTYAITDGNAVAVNNKYVAATTANLWYRMVGERFNLKTTSAQNYLGDGSDNTAARYEMSFRIPAFGASYYFVDFVSGRNMTTSNTAVLDGAAMVDGTGLFSAKSVDGTAVNLTEGTTYQLTADTWYNLEVLIDYSTFAAPLATLYLKDEAGNVLTQSAQYTVTAIPTDSYAQASLMWVAMSATGKYIHFDNTKVNIAPTYADLAANTNLTTVIDDNFEVYEGDNLTYYEVGALYAALVDNMHVQHSDGNVTGINNATIAMETTSIGLDFEDGMTLPETKATKLRFTYDNDVPNSNINYNTIKFVSGGVELTAGVDYVVTAGNDGTLADTSKSFTVEMTKLSGNTTYAIRLMAGLSDYNTATTVTDGAKMGLPADNGLYKDITFTTPDDVATTSIVPTLVDEEGAAVSALANGSVIKGKADITNAGTGDLNGYVILAVYEGDQLVTAKISEAFSATSGATIAAETETVTLAKDGLTAKVFVWNGLDLMQPLAAPAIVPVTAA